MFHCQCVGAIRFMHGFLCSSGSGMFCVVSLAEQLCSARRGVACIRFVQSAFAMQQLLNDHTLQDHVESYFRDIKLPWQRAVVV